MKKPLNEQFRRMQKLAGILNEDYEVKDENERILTDDNGNEVKGTQEEILDLLIPILNSDPEGWDYKITDDGKLVDPLSNDALLSNNAKEYLWNILTQDGLGGTWFAKEQELASMSEEVKKGINENSESGIYKDIEDDLMNGEFESEQEQIEYLQGIIDFCQEQIASLSKG
jgi:hypothetical protein